MTAEDTPPSRYLLIWLNSYASIDARQLSRVRWQIEDLVKEPRENVQIDVWLESPGGDAHAAYKLALILRHVASCIRVVVPDYAKSAATLLALAADELFLAPGAELGPLDAQVPEEGSVFGAISALNIARASDAVAKDALALAMKGAMQMVREANLSRVEALTAMLSFSATFSEPLVRQLDPRLVHQANELLRVTVRYAARLLANTCGEDQAISIAKELVEQFPTHGFVIARDEAEQLGLPVHALEKYDLLPLVQAYHRASESGEAMIEFGPLDDFRLTEDDGEGAKQDERETDARREEGGAPPSEVHVRPDGAEASAEGVG